MNNKEKFSMIKQIYNRNEIGSFLKIMGLTDRICELGVAKGDSLWPLICYAYPKYALAIDVWDEEAMSYFSQERHDNNYARVQQIFSKVKEWAGTDMDIVKGDHSILVDNYEDESFDYIYIDSDHRYEQTVRDIAQWWPKVKKGGILAGHDYNARNKEYGVIQAVDEFVKDNNLEYFHVTSEYPASWIMLKP